MTAALAQQPAQAQRDRLLLEARELVYNNDRNTIEAVGNVQLFYQGRTLEADRVIYDRNTKRVSAVGQARLTEANGTVVTGDRFDLTDDFRDGFIDSLRVLSVERTRFAAPRAERSGGDTVTFETGTYTACEPCKDNPERPPLWQVKAQRIIHKGEEQTIYFEGSTLEFYGVPIAYVPYFWAPDSTVRRKTGFLTPAFMHNSSLGTGVSLPFFWAIAPNYDLTLTPTLLSRQGVLGEVEWRHRLINGAYTIRASGIFQSDPGVFLPNPVGGGERKFRGSVETFGQFHINRNWRFGWDISAATDRFYYQNYRVKTGNLTTTFAREQTSQIYLNGQSANAWFDMRAYYFRPQSYVDWQKQQPVVHPVLDYDKRFDGPAGIGGELRINANITALSREEAAFQGLLGVGKAQGYQVSYLRNQTIEGANYAFYENCAVYTRNNCLLRGVGGFASRASIDVSWRKRIIDPIGQVWTPFASVRADGFFTDLNHSGIVNPQQAAFGPMDGTAARVTPTVGLDYRFPLVLGNGGNGSHIVTPVAQIVASPNERLIARVANEDSQSLVFDDTNLFSSNRFSGYDRIEGGTRLNYGLMYNGNFGNGSSANALFGQSYHLAGTNSFAALDAVGAGVQTGLDQRRSDYVARLQFNPNSFGSITARGRFDERSFAPRAIEVGASGYLGRVSGHIVYARYEAQPERGQPLLREALSLSANLNLSSNWRVFGSAIYDLDKYKWDQISGRTPASPKWYLSNYAFGVGYRDECVVFDIVYSSSFVDGQIAGTRRDTNQTLLFRLELRTLGEFNHSQGVGDNTGGASQGLR